MSKGVVPVYLLFLTTPYQGGVGEGNLEVTVGVIFLISSLVDRLTQPTGIR